MRRPLRRLLTPSHNTSHIGDRSETTERTRTGAALAPEPTPCLENDVHWLETVNGGGRRCSAARGAQTRRRCLAVHWRGSSFPELCSALSTSLLPCRPPCRVARTPEVTMPPVCLHIDAVFSSHPGAIRCSRIACVRVHLGLAGSLMPNAGRGRRRWRGAQRGVVSCTRGPACSAHRR